MNDEEEFLKEHPGLKGKINTARQIINQDITNVVGETCNGYKDDVKWWKSKDFAKLEFVLKETIHKTQLDKQKVKEIAGKIEDKLQDIKENLSEKKLKKIENFGNPQRTDVEKGNMRWAFEDGAVEALRDLKKELGLE